MNWRPDTKSGRVVQTHNRFYRVDCDDRVYLCQPKGHLKRAEDSEYRLPVIGDLVRLELSTQRDGVDGFVTEILERRNRLMRSGSDGLRRSKVMAANLDRILIVSGLVRPGVDWGIVDRYLVTCELFAIPACIVVNKIDLDYEALNDPMLAVYRDLGYPVVETSVEDDVGRDRLMGVVESGLSFFTGASGVGKSSLINWLVPEADLATDRVNARDGSGRHTTTFSILIPVKTLGFLVDSPGLRDFRPPPVPAEQVRFGFVEMAERQAECRFSTCLHLHEPRCRIRELQARGDIHPLRYQNYVEMVQEMQQLFRNRY